MLDNLSYNKRILERNSEIMKLGISSTWASNRGKDQGNSRKQQRVLVVSVSSLQESVSDNPLG